MPYMKNIIIIIKLRWTLAETILHLYSWVFNRYVILLFSYMNSQNLNYLIPQSQASIKHKSYKMIKKKSGRIIAI
jgi:hypothetical protein